MTEQPITNLCIVSDKKNCPPRYNILDRTIENDDGDFWKDKLFKSKSYRYLCYTKEGNKDQMAQLITDLALIGAKDPIPDGYTAITSTADSKETALKKQVLCARFTSKSSTNAAIADICLFKDNSYRERMYTLVGEVNGINLTYKMAQIPVVACRPAPPPPREPISQPTSTLSVNQSTPSYGSIQRQISKQMTGIEGVPFKLNERFAKSGNSSPTSAANLPSVTIRSPDEVQRLTNYDFSRERSIVGAAS